MADGGLRSPRLARKTPAESQAAFARFIAAYYKPCPGCDDQRAGPLHRTSRKLWEGRADRARRHDGTDPFSGVSLADCECHLAAIGPAEAAQP